jgi:SAM-dependent methyltransferase
MADAAFDAFQDSYRQEIERSIAFAGRRHDFYTRVKVGRLLRLARAQVGPPERLRVLDVGCGIGLTDGLLAPHVGTLHGVDVAPGCLAVAARANPRVRYQLAEGERLPYPDGTFDLAFAICVLHHVPPAGWAGFVAEMQRVLRLGGLAVIMEHNPLNPLTRWVVRRCALDRDAVLLSRRRAVRLFQDEGLEVVERRSFLFLPWLGGLASAADWLLGRWPLGAQYCVAGRRVLLSARVPGGRARQPRPALALQGAGPTNSSDA